jgi:hypothetical protein
MVVLSHLDDCSTRRRLQVKSSIVPKPLSARHNRRLEIRGETRFEPT